MSIKHAVNHISNQEFLFDTDKSGTGIDLTLDEISVVSGGLFWDWFLPAIRAQQYNADGSVAYRRFGPDPIGYDDASTGTCHP